jgi:CIC family chloride channel protein
MKELVERRQLLRLGTDSRVLSDLKISELIEKDCRIVPPGMSLGELIHVISHSRRNYYPVEHPETKRFLGIVKFDDIRPYLFEPMMYDVVFVEQIMDTDVQVVKIEDDLTDVLRIMDSEGLYSMPVVDDGRFEGMISKATLLDQYRKELMVQTGHA